MFFFCITNNPSDVIPKGRPGFTHELMHHGPFIFFSRIVFKREDDDIACGVTVTSKFYHPPTARAGSGGRCDCEAEPLSGGGHTQIGPLGMTTKT